MGNGYRLISVEELVSLVYGSEKTKTGSCMDESTPRTDAIIAAADACPETRIVFLIKNLANLAKDLEREGNRLRDDIAGLRALLLEAENK
jgi:hypothetical protein